MRIKPTFNKETLRVFAIAITAVMCTLVILSAVFPFPQGQWDFLSIGTSQKVSANPGIGDYTYKKQLTFNTTAISVTSNQANFPICVHINSSSWPTESERDAFFDTNVDGKRIRFYDADETTNLDYEVDLYNAITHEAIYWVRAPQVDGNSTTDHIHAAYGNDHYGANQDNRTGVWNTNYKAVYHFVPEGTAGVLLTGTKYSDLVGNYLYVCGTTDNALNIFDVSTPGSPVLVGSISGAGSPNYLGAPNCVKVVGNYAYVAATSDNSLTIIDVTDKGTPTFKGKLAGEGAPNYLNDPIWVAISGNYAYVTTLTDTTLVVVNITDPASPTYVTRRTSAGGTYPVCCEVSGNYLFMTEEGEDNLRSLNITDPSTPTDLDNITGTGSPYYLHRAHTFTIVGDYAYVAALEDDSLTIVDISDPSDLTIEGHIVDATYLNSVIHAAVVGNYAYCTTYTSNYFTTVNVTNPASPSVVGHIGGAGTPNYLASCTGIEVLSNYAYIDATADNSLSVFNVSAPASPTFVTHIATPFGMSMTDSTTNNKTATATGVTATTGQVDGGVDFSGTGQYVTLPNTFDFSSGSIFIVAKADVLSGNPYLWAFNGETTNHPSIRLAWATDVMQLLGYDASAYQFQLDAAFTDTTTFHGWAGAWTTNDARLLLDGTQQEADTSVSLANHNSQENRLGYYSLSGIAWDGKMDEVRLSNTARTNDYQKLEWYSVKKTNFNGDSWLSWGSQLGASPAITNTPDSKDFGVLEVNTTSNTAINYFTLSNTGGCTVDVVIYGTDVNGGDDTWDLADNGSPGENIYGLYAGLDDADDLFDIIVRETVTYNTLVSGLLEDATQGWGLKIYMPTSVTNYDAQQMSGTITLVASESS